MFYYHYLVPIQLSLCWIKWNPFGRWLGLPDDAQIIILEPWEQGVKIIQLLTDLCVPLGAVDAKTGFMEVSLIKADTGWNLLRFHPECTDGLHLCPVSPVRLGGRAEAWALVRHQSPADGRNNEAQQRGNKSAAFLRKEDKTMQKELMPKVY